MNFDRVLLGAGLLTVALLPVAYGQREIPPLTSPVVDQAGLMPQALQSQLGNALQSFRTAGGAQIGVLTVPSLEGESLEGFSIRVAEAWRLGDAEKDDGVLLLIAHEDRQVRIEVGQGLEGVLTDAYSRRIVDEQIVPMFKDGEYAAGIIVGVNGITQYTNPQMDFGQYLDIPKRRSQEKGQAGFPLRGLLEIGLWGFIILTMIFGRRRRRGFFYIGGGGGGGFGGGGFGGGGFGGGGFGGGGGGFSGGGASGSW